MFEIKRFLQFYKNFENMFNNGSVKNNYINLIKLKQTRSYKIGIVDISTEW